MHGHGTFLVDLALVLCVAAPTGLLFRFLRLPPILGYLLAGLVVGPHTPIPLFADPERVAALSEFGVVLVMFSVGLEFSIARFVEVLPRSGLTALVQMSALGWAGYEIGQLFGWSGVASLFLAGSLAISSTMVVAKVFDERPPDPGVRELVFGVLVVQDVVAIAMLALLSAVAAGTGVTAGELGTTLLELALFLAALLIGGLLVVPRLVRVVERVGSPETVVVTAAALCFGLSVLALEFGYSVALGAFVAGMLTAESGRGHAVAERIAPVEHLFVAVFFVSVGMSVDPALVAANLGLTVAIFATVVIGQLVSVTVAGLLGGNGLGRSLEAGLSLGQVGEFAFIMAGIGVAAGVVEPYFGACLVAVAILTSFTTPMLVRLAPRLVALVDRLMPGWLRGSLSLYAAWLEQIRGRALPRRWRRPLIVLGLEVAALIGLAIGLGLVRPWAIAALQVELTLGLDGARVVVAVLELAAWLPLVFRIARAARRLAGQFAIDLLPEVEAGRLDLARAPRRALVIGLELALILAATGPVAVFTTPFAGPSTLLLLATVVLAAVVTLRRRGQDLDGHLRASAEVVVELLRKQAQPDPEHPASPPSGSSPSGPPAPQPETLLPGVGQVETFSVSAGPLVGQSFAELDLYGRTGAAVLALIRGQQGMPRPGPEVVLEAGDTLALIGSREALAAARVVLCGSSSSPDELRDQLRTPGHEPPI